MRIELHIDNELPSFRCADISEGQVRRVVAVEDFRRFNLTQLVNLVLLVNVYGFPSP